MLFVAHVGFTVQPQLGNKFIALEDTDQTRRFMLFASVVLLLYVLTFLGGVLGAAQGLAVENPDAVIPTLFVRNLPPVAAGFLNPPEYLAILVWTGIGGIIVTYAGPLLLGVFWDGATSRATLAGVATSFAVYFGLHLGPQLGLYAGLWPFSENPFVSTCVGIVVSIAVTGAGSLLSDAPAVGDAAGGATPSVGSRED